MVDMQGGTSVFSCGVTGDIIAFHQAFHNLTFLEAIKDLQANFLCNLTNQN